MVLQSKNSGISSALDSLYERAENFRGKSRYHQSLRTFRKALVGYASLRDIFGMYQCNLSLGGVYRMIGKFDHAQTAYLQAIELAKQMKSSIKAADAKVGLGLSLRAQGNWQKALVLIRGAKRTYEACEDIQGIAFSLWAEAGALRIKGDIPDSIITFKESYGLFKSLRDSHGAGYCLCGLGGSSRAAGNIGASLKYYLRANRLFVSLHDVFGKAYSFCGIGNAYRMLGAYDESFVYFKKATKLYKTIGDHVSYAYTLWGMSTSYKMMHQYGRAVRYLENARALFKKTKDARGIIYTKLGFGEIALLCGDMKNARKYLNAAYREARKKKFSLEFCHAQMLMSYLDGSVCQKRSKIHRMPEATGTTERTCYNQIGVKLKLNNPPVNIP